MRDSETAVSAVYDLCAGAPVLIRNAFGDWLPAVAASAVEATHRDGRKIHDFPVIWVLVDRERLSWPIEDVLPRDDPPGVKTENPPT